MTAVVCIKAVRCLKGKLKQRGDWAGRLVNTVPSVFPREPVLGMTFVMIRKTGLWELFAERLKEMLWVVLPQLAFHIAACLCCILVFLLFFWIM